MIPEDFLRLLINSKCLIGNSSVGIRECAFLGIPVVNIGTRQQGRARGKNVLDVSYEEKAIKEGILDRIQAHGSMVNDTTYGKGNSGEKIANILSDITLRFHKTITY